MALNILQFSKSILCTSTQVPCAWCNRNSWQYKIFGVCADVYLLLCLEKLNFKENGLQIAWCPTNKYKEL
jgi:hypothetical protein